MVKQIQPIILIEVNDRFAISLGIAYMPSLSQTLAQFSIVIDFAVEDKRDTSVLVVEWLVAAIHINDTQTAHPQSNVGLKVKTITVRSTMADNLAHLPYKVR